MYLLYIYGTYGPEIVNRKEMHTITIQKCPEDLYMVKRCLNDAGKEPPCVF